MAHAGKEIALSLVGVDGFLLCLVKHPHLLLRKAEIFVEYKQHGCENNQGAANHNCCTYIIQLGDCLIERVIFHNTDQIPAGAVGDGRTINLPFFSLNQDTTAIDLLCIHCLLQQTDQLLHVSPVILPIYFPDAFKIAVSVRAAIADHKIPFLIDDVGINLFVILIQIKGLI